MKESDNLAEGPKNFFLFCKTHGFIGSTNNRSDIEIITNNHQSSFNGCFGTLLQNKEDIFGKNYDQIESYRRMVNNRRKPGSRR